MSKPVDWTVGIPASKLIAVGTPVSGKFPLDGASARDLLYRMDGKNITSYIVYDDSGRAIKRVDLTGKGHANVPTPHAVEYKHNQNPAGDIFVQAENTVRPARLDEIP
jgi:filamentous hemagglutinin